MTLAEIADALNVPLDTVRHWDHRGDILPASARRKVGPRLVRYARAGIEEWLAESAA